MLRSTAVGLAALAVALVLGAGPALAHEGEEGGSAREFALAAIALIVNDPGDHDAILDKIKDAQEAEDRSGVELGLVAEAQDAFEAGDAHEARSLLERAVGARPHRGNSEPAEIREPPAKPIGAEPGRAIPTNAVAGRRGFPASDWVILVVALGVAAGGVGLAVRYRPRHVEPR